MDSRPDGPLSGIKVLILTSGHDVTDHRVYHKQGRTLALLGATVTIVGKAPRGCPDDVNILPIPAGSSRMLRFLWAPWVCVWKARWHQAEIIHVHDAEMLMVAIPAKLWWRGSKFIYDVHEDFPCLLLIRDWLPEKLRPMAKVVAQLVEKTLALCADAIVAVTAPLARKFRNQTKVAIYNYPAAQFFDSAGESTVRPSNRQYDLVHLGTLTQRRTQFLVKTIQIFHEMRPNARSMVIGLSPENRALLEAQVPANCVLLGKTDYQMIPKLLSDCKVGLDVHPWLGQHLEVALPVKVCEYMGSGCAVVSSRMPVLDEILNEARMVALNRSVRLLRSTDPMEYARAVLDLVESIEKGEDPGMLLRTFALSQMNWETEAGKLSNLYLRLLGRPCGI